VDNSAPLVRPPPHDHCMALWCKPAACIPPPGKPFCPPQAVFRVTNGVFFCLFGLFFLNCRRMI